MQISHVLKKKQYRRLKTTPDVLTGDVGLPRIKMWKGERLLYKNDARFNTRAQALLFGT